LRFGLLRDISASAASPVLSHEFGTQNPAG
jgi:hypothetical protein